MKHNLNERDDLTYEERAVKHYKDQLKEYRKYLSQYHWHLHITFRQGYNDYGYTFPAKDFNGLERRNKIVKSFISKLRASLKLKENQLLYAYVHEYDSGGHIHLLIQFRKIIST